MKATALEFRFRFLIHVIVYAIAFFAPWNYAFHFDSIRTWQLVAATVSRWGWLSFSAATITVLALGIFFAFAAAALRTWGAAFLGASVVQGGGLHGDQVVAAGPYRFVRNPLYLGTMLHTLALALLMPPSGAVFCIVAIGIIQLRLIGAEEDFLTAKQGDGYLAYRRAVPRLFPALAGRVPASAARPRWFAAFGGELYFWGAAVSFAVAGWRYNAQLVLQGVIISFGVALIALAVLPKE